MTDPDPYYCRRCRTHHPVRSISDIHNAQHDQEDE